MKQILLFSFLIILPLAICAQSTDEVAKNINTIKRDTTYIYAEATTNNVDSAIYSAKAILEVKVSEWIRSQHPAESFDVCIAKAKEHTFDVRTRRGNFQRAFVYVNKRDILPIANRSEVVVFEVASNEETPMSTSTKATLSEEPDMSGKTSQPTITLKDEEHKLATFTNLTELNEFLVSMKKQQRLAGYGKADTMPKDIDIDICICDKQGHVVAMLRRQPDGTCVNLKTLQSDTPTNYPHAAVWFKLK